MLSRPRRRGALNRNRSMTLILYALLTLNGLVTLVLGRRPITLDKTPHAQYRLLGAFEATVFPVTLGVLFLAGMITALSAGGGDAADFTQQHAGLFRATRIAVLGVYLIITVVWEKSIRARIAAGR